MTQAPTTEPGGEARLRQDMTIKLEGGEIQLEADGWEIHDGHLTLWKDDLRLTTFAPGVWLSIERDESPPA